VILQTIPRNSITFGERFREDYGDLNELASSMKKDGIIQPLAVKYNGESSYILLAGGRRFKAAEIASIDEIPVRVYPADITDLDMRFIELMENVCRKDLSWIEAAKLRKEIHRLQIQIHGEGKASTGEGWSQEQTANLLNVDRTTISKDLQLADALEQLPILERAKTRAEAVKMLKKLTNEVEKAHYAKHVMNEQETSPLDRVRREIASRFILGDFFEMVKQVPDGSIDFVEIDPPYAIDLQELKQNESGGMDHYNEVDKRDYVDFIIKTLQESWRVMSENSWLIIWFGADPWFEPIYLTLKAVGFKAHRLPAIWVKGTGQSMNPERSLANSYEMFFYARKGDPKLSKAGRVNTFLYKPVYSGRKIHPTERPVEMMEDIISTFSPMNGRILVPFAGSGNTILAAANKGLTAFGYDLAPEYRDAYISRVFENRPPHYKSYAEVLDDVS
jgi:ParB/RepB/Spo0J family partition protein